MDDVRRVSARMLATKPAIAALGNLGNMPKFEDIEAAFANKGNFRSASRFFLFRNWEKQNPTNTLLLLEEDDSAPDTKSFDFSLALSCIPGLFFTKIQSAWLNEWAMRHIRLILSLAGISPGA